MSEAKRKTANAKITLDQARKVIEAHHEAERRATRKENRRLVGRFYKYRNTYGSGDAWWLYGAVTGVDEFGRVTGWKFERTSLERIEISLDDSMHVNTGWKEIGASEFWGAAEALRDTLNDLLTRR
jgi:hypothetical protein